MAKPLIVRVLGEDSKFLAMLRRDAAASSKFEQTLVKTNITAKQSADAQIAASLKKDARLREEIQLYRQIASAAERGSREQVIASNLADQAERRLARSMGATRAEAQSLGRSTQSFNRDLGAATRGALAGSGIFRGLGRSIVFASGGFLAFGGVTAFFRKSIDAAKEAEVTNKQLEQQFKNNRRSIEPYRAEIDRTANSLSALSGFQNDEIKAGLTTILRTQPNVNKALRDEATAADLARAKRIGLAQASIIVAKVEAGNTTLLRRQGIQVRKNATAEEALAVLRQKVAGQARAGATEQERFGAILHTTEEIVGTALLPTLNKYLISGGKWLEQMNESGKLEHDVANAAHEISSAVDDAAKVIHTVDSVTGSFKNTLELLLALKVASAISRWTTGLSGLIGTAGSGGTGLRGAAAESGALRSNLGQLARTSAIAIGIDMIFTAKGDVGIAQRIFGGALIGGSVGGVPGALIGGTAAGGAPFFKKAITDEAVSSHESLPIFKGGKWVDPVTRKAVADQAFWNREYRKGHGATEHPRNGQNPYDGAGLAAQVARFKKASQGLGGTGAPFGPPIPTTPPATGPDGKPLTVKQRNEFFDNAIARILRRGALGDIQQQIDALVQADQLIAKRIAVTKDVTRRLNLEDQLLQNQAQIRQLKSEQAANAEQAAQDAHQRLLDLLQKRADARNARQFKALGLTASGDTVAPSVRQLRNALGKFEDTVQGTFLDTTKTESTIARIRRVLAGGLGAVGRDVRLKIQSILQDLNQQLDQTTQGNITKWRHLSSEAILAGVPNLTGAQKRILENRLSVLGPSAGAPPTRTAAFALAATAFGKFTVESTLNVDGETMATNITSHQIRRGKLRTVPRSG